MLEKRKRFINVVKANASFLVIYEILTAASVVGYLMFALRSFRIAGVQECTEDLFIIMSDPYVVALFQTPLFLLLLTLIFRNDKRVQAVIRTRSRSVLFRKMTGKMIAADLFFAVHIAAWIGVTALLSKSADWNWSEKYSLYWSQCGYAVYSGEPVGIGKVLVVFVVTEMLIFGVVGILFVFLRYFTSNYLLAWVIGESLVIYNWRGRIDQKLIIDWNIWRMPEVWMRDVCMALLFIGIVFVAANMLSERKEFLNEK